MTHEEELIELLDATNAEKKQDDGELEQQRAIIEKTFREFGLQGSIVHAYCAPQVNCYDFTPASGEKLNAYEKCRDNILRPVYNSGTRMILSASGQRVCRMEVLREHRAEVTAGELFRSAAWRDSHATLPLMLGKNVNGYTVILDLAKAPHLLIGGSTGTGKSVFMNSCLHSLMFKYTPRELKLILVDPKVVEFAQYNGLPYLQFPIINSTKETLCALQWLIMEMERRYVLLSKTGCKDIKDLNIQKSSLLPYIVMIINEYSDFMLEARSQMELLLTHLCAKSRSIGIHLIIGTKRPSQDVLTSKIKANFCNRIALRMASTIDSRWLINSNDAANLLGHGDMLFYNPWTEMTRIQGVYVNEQESDRIVYRLISKYGDLKPNPLPNTPVTGRNQICLLRDKLFDIARDVLEDKMDWLKDEIIEEACDGIADSLLEHLGELRKGISEVDEEANECDNVESDSECDNALSEDRELLLKAIRIVVEYRKPSASYLQRQLGIGYNKSAALLEMMERCGIVSPQEGSRSRTILVDTYEEAVSRLPKQN